MRSTLSLALALGACAGSSPEPKPPAHLMRSFETKWWKGEIDPSFLPLEGIMEMVEGQHDRGKSEDDRDLLLRAWEMGDREDTVFFMRLRYNGERTQLYFTGNKRDGLCETRRELLAHVETASEVELIQDRSYDGRDGVWVEDEYQDECVIEFYVCEDDNMWSATASGPRADRERLATLLHEQLQMVSLRNPDQDG
ncbi:MAG: hypothetical protein AAGD10_02370 [Myxococcota bacterium]